MSTAIMTKSFVGAGIAKAAPSSQRVSRTASRAPCKTLPKEFIGLPFEIHSIACIHFNMLPVSARKSEMLIFFKVVSYLESPRVCRPPQSPVPSSSTDPTEAHSWYFLPKNHLSFFSAILAGHVSC